MTPRQIIASHIRQNRTIPTGSIIWLHVAGMEDLVSIDEVGRSLDTWLDKVGSPSELSVYLDTPEGDFEDEWCINTKDLNKLPLKPKPKPPRKVTARQEIVAAFGERMILTAEKITQLYADYLVARYQRDYAYIGKLPVVRVNWGAKNSWGCSRYITIGPAYLYRPELATLYSGRYFGYRFNEYLHVCQDLEIGSFYSMSRLDHIKAIVAHELAHFFQFNARKHNFDSSIAKECLPQLDYRTSHGEGWQYLYRYMRKPFNNGTR